MGDERLVVNLVGRESNDWGTSKLSNESMVVVVWVGQVSSGRNRAVV
jgi:hypothetical protein